MIHSEASETLGSWGNRGVCRAVCKVQEIEDCNGRSPANQSSQRPESAKNRLKRYFSVLCTPYELARDEHCTDRTDPIADSCTLHTHPQGFKRQKSLNNKGLGKLSTDIKYFLTPPTHIHRVKASFYRKIERQNPYIAHRIPYITHQNPYFTHPSTGSCAPPGL